MKRPAAILIGGPPALVRDENKIHDPESFLAGLDLGPPVVPHLALDATQPTAALVRSVLDYLAR